MAIAAPKRARIRPPVALFRAHLFPYACPAAACKRKARTCRTAKHHDRRPRAIMALSARTGPCLGTCRRPEAFQECHDGFGDDHGPKDVRQPSRCPAWASTFVLTRDRNWQQIGVEVAHGKDEALALAGDDRVRSLAFGCLSMFTDVADKIEPTEVLAEVEGDVFMDDPCSTGSWREIACEDHLPEGGAPDIVSRRWCAARPDQGFVGIAASGASCPPILGQRAGPCPGHCRVQSHGAVGHYNAGPALWCRADADVHHTTPSTFSGPGAPP